MGRICDLLLLLLHPWLFVVSRLVYLNLRVNGLLQGKVYVSSVRGVCGVRLEESRWGDLLELGKLEPR